MSAAVSEPVSPELLRRFDVAGPRYTSYPTADRFVEAFGEQDYMQALNQRIMQFSLDVLCSIDAQGRFLHSSSTVYEALHGKGMRHITGVDLRRITGKGEVASSGTQLDCDLLCMSAGYMPVYQLLCQAGGKLSYDDSQAAFALSGLPQNLSVTGSVNGRHHLGNLLSEAAQVAAAACARLGLQAEPVQAEFVAEARVNFDWPIFPHPQGKDFVDFDEDLQVADIVNATRIGYRDVQLVKRYSTVGMGPSQGRHSALPTARLVARATGRSVGETGVTTARPPFVAEKLAHVAGRGAPWEETGRLIARFHRAGLDHADLGRAGHVGEFIAGGDQRSAPDSYVGHRSTTVPSRWK